MNLPFVFLRFQINVYVGFRVFFLVKFGGFRN